MPKNAMLKLEPIEIYIIRYLNFKIYVEWLFLIKMVLMGSRN